MTFDIWKTHLQTFTVQQNIPISLKSTEYKGKLEVCTWKSCLTVESQLKVKENLTIKQQHCSNYQLHRCDTNGDLSPIICYLRRRKIIKLY